MDLQLAGQLTDAIRVIGAYAYVDAEVTRDNTLARGVACSCRAQRQPADHLRVPGWRSARSFLGGALNYVGDRAGQAHSDFELPSYTTVDLLARYQPRRT